MFQVLRCWTSIFGGFGFSCKLLTALPITLILGFVPPDLTYPQLIAGQTFIGRPNHSRWFGLFLQPYAPVYDHAYAPAYDPGYDPAIPVQDQVTSIADVLILICYILSTTFPLQAYAPAYDASYASTYHPNYDPNYDPNYNLARNQVSDHFYWTHPKKSGGVVFWCQLWSQLFWRNTGEVLASSLLLLNYQWFPGRIGHLILPTLLE